MIPSSRLTSSTIASSNPAAAGQQDRRREARRRPDSRPRRGACARRPGRTSGRNRSSLRPGMPGGTIELATCDSRRPNPRAPPSGASRPPRRTPCGPGRRRTAAGSCRSRSTGWRAIGTSTELRSERLVVGDPRRVDAADRRVVELAVLERLDRAPAAEVADELDLRDGRSARPSSGRWRSSSRPVRGRPGQDVAAARHEPGAGLQRGRVRADRWRNDREARSRPRCSRSRWPGRTRSTVRSSAGVVGMDADRGGVRATARAGTPRRPRCRARSTPAATDAPGR